MASEIWDVPGVMKYWAENKPDKEVFRFVDRSELHSVWTPSEIHAMTKRFAARLHKLGFVYKDVIANGLPNSPERLVTDLGIIAAGCVTVNCQVIERDGSDFWNTAALAKCKGVIIPARPENASHRLVSPLLQDTHSPRGCATISVPKVPTLTKAIVVDRISADASNSNISDHADSLLTSLRSDTVDRDFCYKAKPSDIAVLFATSGTTGFCKLVPRTHEEILRAGRGFDSAADKKYFSDRSFGWMGGFPFDYLATCSPRILQDKMNGKEAIEALDLWQIIVREECDGASLTPTTVMSLMQKFRNSPPNFKLKFMVVGGQPLRNELTETIGVLTHALVLAYASTEAAMASVGFVVKRSEYEDFFCGKPREGVQLRVVDQHYNDVSPGVEGEVLLKSYLMFKGYYKQGEITCSSSMFTSDGWFRTEDRGKIDHKGNFYCFGRSGDVVSQGTVIIHTSWPESVLAKSPDVAEAFVTPMPGATEDGALCACVVLRRGSDVTEENLMGFYTKSFMGAWVPKLSRIFFFDQFPQTSSNKLYKKGLMDKLKQKLNVPAQPYKS